MWFIFFMIKNYINVIQLIQKHFNEIKIPYYFYIINNNNNLNYTSC